MPRAVRGAARTGLSWRAAAAVACAALATACSAALADCVADGGALASNGDCFFAQGVRTDPVSADASCQSTYGGRLASIRDAGDAAAIAALFAQLNNGQGAVAWIGLRAAAGTENHAWLDGDTSTFFESIWATSEPGNVLEECVFVHGNYGGQPHDGKLADHWCHDSQTGFSICRVPGPACDDRDNDGECDDTDAFPDDPTESADTDGDGVGDNADAFPNDPTETTDTDGDGVGDNADAFPNDPTEDTDTDGDGIGDNADAFPNDPLNIAPCTPDASPAGNVQRIEGTAQLIWPRADCEASALACGDTVALVGGVEYVELVSETVSMCEVAAVE